MVLQNTSITKTNIKKIKVAFSSSMHTGDRYFTTWIKFKFPGYLLGDHGRSRSGVNYADTVKYPPFRSAAVRTRKSDGNCQFSCPAAENKFACKVFHDSVKTRLDKPGKRKTENITFFLNYGVAAAAGAVALRILIVGTPATHSTVARYTR